MVLSRPLQVHFTRLSYWAYLPLQYIFLAFTMVMIPVVWGALLVGAMALRLVVGTGGVVALWPVLQWVGVYIYIALLVGLKWVLVQRMKPGVYPLYGWMYLRWVTLRALQKQAGSTFFHVIRRTWLLPFVYRLLGAHIEDCSSTIIDTLDIMDADMITIKRGALIYQGASITGAFVAPPGYVGRHAMLVISPVVIGEECHLGAKSVVTAGVPPPPPPLLLLLLPGPEPATCLATCPTTCAALASIAAAAARLALCSRRPTRCTRAPPPPPAGTTIPDFHNLKPHASPTHPGDAPVLGPLSDYPHFTPEEHMHPVLAGASGLVAHFVESCLQLPGLAASYALISLVINRNPLGLLSDIPTCNFDTSCISWDLVIFTALFSTAFQWLARPLSVLCTIPMLALWKRLLVGRLVPGSNVAASTPRLFAYSVFRRLVEGPGWVGVARLFGGTPVMAWLYRFMGSKIGKEVRVALLCLCRWVGGWGGLQPPRW